MLVNKITFRGFWYLSDKHKVERRPERDIAVATPDLL